MSWYALGAVIFWGFSFIATKVAVMEVHPFTLLVVRYAIGVFLLLFAQMRRDKRFLGRFSGRDWVTILFLAVVGVSALGLLQAFGLMYTTAVNTGWIIAVAPILIALGSRIFLKEVVTWRKVFGIALGFFGIFLIISKGVFSLDLFRIPSTFGDLLVFGSTVAWTIFTIVGKGFLSRFPSLATVTTIMMAGCFTVLPLSLVHGEWNALFHLSLAAWAGILFLGVFCSGLGYLFWYAALEKKESSVVGMYLYLEPFATLLGASVLLGEEIRGITLLGGGLTLLGVYLTTASVSKRSVRSGIVKPAECKNSEKTLDKDFEK